ncbi:YcxB family protein [Streptomyces coeruleoprunus]|uniref:YcxB family protein n=1 Tax=Streptomyces coeruleoprunus TaxID=285563 RepID=A0ABV9X5J2_9ACTN
MTTTDDVEAVELVYRPTVADAQEMLRARMRGTPGGRWTTRLLLAVGVVGLLLLAALRFGPEPDEPALIGGLFGLTGASFGLPFLLPRIQGRQLYRVAAPQGEHRAVVDDHGVRWVTDHTQMSTAWQFLPRYVETPGLFVLLTGDRNGLGVACLPKRGVVGPDGVDRLRAVLDRRAARL